MGFTRYGCKISMHSSTCRWFTVVDHDRDDSDEEDDRDGEEDGGGTHVPHKNTCRLTNSLTKSNSYSTTHSHPGTTTTSTS